MADLSDVEAALAAFIANVLYPNGTSVDSAVGTTCRVYRGFPATPGLDSDLNAGVVNISVAAVADTAKNVTRYPRRWHTVTPVPQRLNVAVEGVSATFSGMCAAGQLAGIAVNNTTFPYAVQVNDSPATVARAKTQ